MTLVVSDALVAPMIAAPGLQEPSRLLDQWRRRKAERAWLWTQGREQLVYRAGRYDGRLVRARGSFRGSNLTTTCPSPPTKLPRLGAQGRRTR